MNFYSGLLIGLSFGGIGCLMIWLKLMDERQLNERAIRNMAENYYTREI